MGIFNAVFGQAKPASQPSPVLQAMSEHQGVVELGLDGRILQANSQFCQQLAVNREQLEGQTQGQWLQAGQSPAQQWSQLTNGQSLHGVFTFNGGDGQKHHLQCNYLPVRDDSGVVNKVVLLTADQTDEEQRRQQAEQRLAEKERESSAMRSALDVCSTNVMMADTDLHITYLNASLEAMFKGNEDKIREALPNFRVDGLIGRNIDDFHSSPAHQRRLMEALSDTYVGEINIAGLTFELIANPMTNDHGERIGTVVEWRDRTKELAGKKREQALARESRRIKQALDNVQTGTLIADSKNEVVYVNLAVNKILRRVEAEILKNDPQFDSQKLVGSQFDSFLRAMDNNKQLDLASDKTQAVDVRLGRRTLALTMNSITTDDNERIGTVIEFEDRTTEVNAEREIGKVVRAAAAGDFSQRIDESDKDDFELMLAKNLNELTVTAEAALNDIARVMLALSKGDLTQHIEQDYEGKFDELKGYCNTTVDNLTDIIGEIKGSAETINTASTEIAQGNTDLSSRTEQQASNLEETASSMEELTGTVQQNADNAKQANSLSTKASQVAGEGGDLIKQVVNTMAEINESAQKISDIIGVIDGIAFQTNILALNAAVEAARAGEQGKGFAVVASEVRTLAQRSADAAKDIKGLISDSVNKIENGNTLVNRSGDTMKEIVTSITQVNDLMSEIAAASIEQSTGIEEVTKAVTQMDEMTQQNAALVEESAASAESLQGQAEQMTIRVQNFRLSEDDEPAPAAIAPAPMAKPSPKAAAHKANGQSRIPTTPSSSEDEWEEF